MPFWRCAATTTMMMRTGRRRNMSFESDHDTKWNVWEDWKIVCIILLKIELTTVAHINPSDGVNYSKIINYEMREWVSSLSNNNNNNKTHKQHEKRDDMSTSAISSFLKLCVWYLWKVWCVFSAFRLVSSNKKNIQNKMNSMWWWRWWCEASEINENKIAVDGEFECEIIKEERIVREGVRRHAWK